MKWSSPLLGGLLAVGIVVQMFASDSNLHPLRKPIGPGEIQFTLRRAASAGEAYGVECTYRPYRERDVKKSRNLNLLRGWIGSGSRDLIRVQREEFHIVRQHIQATGPDLTFSVSLRDSEAGYGAYQLETVRVVGRITGTLEFERWSAATPNLDAGFGFKCEEKTLRGQLRCSGLRAQPLRGASPLWPTLRTVDLDFAPVEVPTVQFYESREKHHWDGWRQTTPQFWPGGQTIVARHISKPTVWREHEYYAFAGSQEPLGLQPTPPPGLLPGVQLEVYWPEGESLEFPETRFERDVEVNAVPLSKLPARMAELLAQSVRMRPGWEASSMSAKEWKELEASVPELEMPMTIQMTPSGADGETRLKIMRDPTFTEPWLICFGAAYDDARRFIVKSLLVRPESWTGPLPD